MPPGYIGRRGVDSRQRPEASAKTQQQAKKNRRQGQGGGLLQKAGADLARCGADAGQNPELVQARLHGDFKRIADQQNQRGRHNAEHSQKERQQQRWGGIVWISHKVS